MSIHVSRRTSHVRGGTSTRNGTSGTVTATGPINRDPAHALVHVFGPIDGLVESLDVETTNTETEDDGKDDKRADDGSGLTGRSQVAVFKESGLDRVGELAEEILGFGSALVGNVIVGCEGRTHGVTRVPRLIAGRNNVERDRYRRVVVQVTTPPTRVKLGLVELLRLGNALEDVDGQILVGHGRRVDVDVDFGNSVVETALIPSNVGDVGDLNGLTARR